ncbi:MAG: GHKL domain-containing protein [Lachnospiraceae bacterium]|nr:GHKL domain-containing protein [Lachnospiraceae bacterium]
MIFELFSYVLDYFTNIIYLNEYLGNKREDISKKMYYLIFIFAEILIILTYHLCYDGFYTTKIAVTFILSFLLLTGLAFLHQSPIKRKLFTALSLQVITGLSATICLLIISLLPSVASHHLTIRPYHILFCTKLITFALIWTSFLLIKPKTKGYSITYYLLLLFIPLISFFMIAATSHTSKMTPKQLTFTLLGLVALLFTNIANYYLLRHFIHMTELEDKVTNLKKQLIYQSKNYQQISTAYRSTRKIIHDTKKHFRYINECIKKEHYSSINAYLAQLINELEDSHTSINTGNLVIDAFIGSSRAQAENEHITFTTKIQINTDYITVSDYDLCIILGNLLDNALEACQKVIPPKPKQINVNIFTTPKKFVIHICNTYADIPTSQESVNLQVLHGYGIPNVKSITSKYYGTYTFFTENDIYHSIVNIPYIDDTLRLKLDLEQ